jgi:fatty acid desaturase
VKRLSTEEIIPLRLSKSEPSAALFLFLPPFFFAEEEEAEEAAGLLEARVAIRRDWRRLPRAGGRATGFLAAVLLAALLWVAVGWWGVCKWGVCRWGVCGWVGGWTRHRACGIS